MTDGEPSPLPDLRRWLRGHGEPDAGLELTRAQVAALADELARLRQSVDRLRKQNRKLRRRAEPGSAADPAADPTGDRS